MVAPDSAPKKRDGLAPVLVPLANVCISRDTHKSHITDLNRIESNRIESSQIESNQISSPLLSSCILFCFVSRGCCFLRSNVTAVCGDRMIKGSENCDDGNAIGGDGCGTSCTVETGWKCPTLGSPCVGIWYVRSLKKKYFIFVLN
jgi:cysteine-rich repeat protein